MQTTTALRLYGKRDLRLETFTLPAMQDDEILARVVTDSLCLSSWKEANQGADHKKVPDDVATRPIIIGHEFCGEILAVGKKWQHKFQPGQRYVIQANLQLPDRPDCPGYSFPWIGGEATHVVIPNEVMAQDCLLTWEGDTWFEGSLVEPLSCVIGAFNANYHLQEGSYNHVMGIRPQGRTLILGGTGPMGLLAIDYALHGPINFYDVHYAFTHYVGTSGGNTDDMRAAVALMQAKKVQTAKVVTHILGLNAAGETTLDLPAVGGGKKLVYTGKAFPLTPLGEIADPELAAIVARHHGIWSQEAEAYLLAHAEDITHD